MTHLKVHLEDLGAVFDNRPSAKLFVICYTCLSFPKVLSSEIYCFVCFYHCYSTTLPLFSYCYVIEAPIKIENKMNYFYFERKSS